MRGFAILGVVLLHAYVNPWDGIAQWEFTVMHALHLLAQTAVPVFLFASGLLLAREDSQPMVRFWRRKWEKIFLPAAVMMVLIALFRVWAFDWEWKWVRESLVRFDVSGQYYYIAVLLILYAIFRIIVRPLPTRAVHVVTALSFVVGLATVAWYEQQTVQGEMAVFAYRNPAIWMFFYAAGYSLGRTGRDLAIPAPVAVVAAIVAAVSAMVFFVQGLMFDSYPVSYFGVTVFLFSASMLAVYPAMSRWLLNTVRGTDRVADLLSRYSLGIFFIHAPFFIGYLNHHVGAWPGDYLVAMFALAAFGLLGSLATLILLDILLPPAFGALAGLDARSSLGVARHDASAPAAPAFGGRAQVHQASTDARFLPSRGAAGRIERSKFESQKRDSAGSIASSMPK